MEDKNPSKLIPASMQKWVMPTLYGVLAIYTLALLIMEFRTSQDYIRNYFADITGPVDLFAINTTLSVFLMWGAALMFLVALVCVVDRPNSSRLQWFLVSQILVFAFLGFDDRFQFHEKVSWHLGFPDHYILIAVGFLETVCLFVLGRETIVGRAAWYLGIAVILFLVMLVIDALVPHDLVLRLSAEDLAKLWGCLFFFLFAWEICVREINRLKEAN